jgi:Uri superfamily endonuclease
MTIRGSYCLCIKVKKDLCIQVGALGMINFTNGLYVYIGSALNSLIPRLARHLKTNIGEGKAIHWHIDYLLCQPDVEIQKIYVNERVVRLECEIASNVAENGRPMTGFGCSDCNCPSHLYIVESFGFLEKMGLKKRDLTKLTS